MLKTLPPGRVADYVWIIVAMGDRNYKAVLDKLGSLSFDTLELQTGYFHKDLAYAGVYNALKEPSAMKSHADLARVALEKTVSEHPDDPAIILRSAMPMLISAGKRRPSGRETRP